MNKFHKILLIMVSAFLVMMMPVCDAEAAGGQPGEKVTVTFTFNDIRGIDGNFTFSNSDLFSEIVYSSSFPETRFNNNKVFYSTTEAGTKSGTISVIVTIKENASAGDSCTITLENINLTDANTNSVSGGSRSETVTVGTTSSGGNQVVVNTPVPGNSNAGTVNTTPVPGSSGTSSTSRVDYSELKKQIEIAGAVKTEGCTKASKDAFATALANAKNALSSYSQSEVDAAATALKNAINGMEKMDYSSLKAAIESATVFTDTEEAASLIKQLLVALNNATLLLESDDQAAVDAATAEINSILEQLQEALSGGKITFNPTEEKEPEGDYCNIKSHKVWPILFFISLAANIVLVVLFVLTFKKRKALPGADTPLVDYDIDDDNF